MIAAHRRETEPTLFLPSPCEGEEFERLSLRSPKRRGVEGQPLLTVIVPVYNEVGTIDELLRRVLASTLSLPSPFKGEEYEDAGQLIVVDDGSTDGTREKLHAWMDRVRVLTHATNRGKGAAIRSGLERARGEFTIIQDADLEYDPADYARLIEPLLTGEADVVYGSRYLTRSQVQSPRSKVVGGDCAGSGDPRTTTRGFISRSEMTTLCATPGDSHTTTEKESGDESPHSKSRWSACRWGVAALNLAVRWLYGVGISDEATCYKVFVTADLRAMNLMCEGFEFCPEVTAKACRMGLSIGEVPISYNARSVAEGKKIRWRDGWTAIKTLWRWRKWSVSGLRFQVSGSKSVQMVRGRETRAQQVPSRRVLHGEDPLPASP